MSQSGAARGSGGGGGGGFGLFRYRNVDQASYNVAASDEFLGVTTSTQATAIQLPNTALTGQAFVIKDISGNASVHNITVSTVSGTTLIDGSTSLTINSDYESVQFMYNGSAYLAF